jgi:hypothetical protein
VLAPNQAFQTVWRVRNTADDWLTNSADLVYVRGETFSGPLRVDFTSRVNGEEYANLPTINMRAPSVRGTYNATWNIQIGHTTFCSLPLNIIVQ